MNWHRSSCSSRCFGIWERKGKRSKTQRPRPPSGGEEEGRNRGVTTVRQSRGARTVRSTRETASDWRRQGERLTGGVQCAGTERVRETGVGKGPWVGVRGNAGVPRSSPCSRATERKGRGRVKSQNDSFPKGSAQAVGKRATGARARTARARCPERWGANPDVREFPQLVCKTRRAGGSRQPSAEAWEAARRVRSGARRDPLRQSGAAVTEASGAAAGRDSPRRRGWRWCWG